MTGQRIQRNPFTPDPRYTESFKLMVVREFEQGTLNKDQLSLKYSIPGHNTILRWCRKYGKLHYPASRRGIIGRPMKDPAQQKIKELEWKIRTTLTCSPKIGPSKMLVFTLYYQEEGGPQNAQESLHGGTDRIDIEPERE